MASVAATVPGLWTSCSKQLPWCWGITRSRKASSSLKKHLPHSWLRCKCLRVDPSGLWCAPASWLKVQLSPRRSAHAQAAFIALPAPFPCLELYTECQPSYFQWSTSCLACFLLSVGFVGVMTMQANEKRRSSSGQIDQWVWNNPCTVCTYVKWQTHWIFVEHHHSLWLHLSGRSPLIYTYSTKRVSGSVAVFDWICMRASPSLTTVSIHTIHLHLDLLHIVLF